MITDEMIKEDTLLFLKKCHGREKNILEAANKPVREAKKALTDLYWSWGFSVAIGKVGTHLRHLEIHLGSMAELSIVLNVTPKKQSGLSPHIARGGGRKSAFLDLFEEESESIDQRLLIRATSKRPLDKKLFYECLPPRLARLDAVFENPSWVLFLAKVDYAGPRRKGSVMDHYLADIKED